MLFGERGSTRFQPPAYHYRAQSALRRFGLDRDAVFFAARGRGEGRLPALCRSASIRSLGFVGGGGFGGVILRLPSSP